MALITWRAPQLSSDSELAIENYRHGVVELVAGTGRAVALLDVARRADPLFALAHVDHAILAGLAADTPVGATTTRGERQHIETVRLWQRGDPQRAGDLRREHLLEFAGDLVIVVLPLLVVRNG